MALLDTFKSSGKATLQSSLGKANVHEVPEISKVIVAVGIGSLATRKGMKDFSEIESNLSIITGQKPQMILSKQSISNFKLREDMPSMLRVTLRNKKAYDFIERLVMLVFPRLRDFDGLSDKKFDGRGNYSLGLKNLVVFPELTPESITLPVGLQITIVTTSDVDAEAKQLLESLGIIFLKKK